MPQCRLPSHEGENLWTQATSREVVADPSTTARRLLTTTMSCTRETFSSMTQWSRRHGCCTACGTTDRKHYAHGLCSRCYLIEWNSDPANRALAQEAKRRWYNRSVTPETRAERRNREHFGGNRQLVLDRDGHKCVQCGRTQSLVVHHKDGTGRGLRDGNNNHPDNLVTLCRSCHINVHRHRKGDRWSLMYDCCVTCGTTERSHNSGGECWLCADRRRRQVKKKIQSDLHGDMQSAAEMTAPAHGSGNKSVKRLLPVPDHLASPTAARPPVCSAPSSSG